MRRPTVDAKGKLTKFYFSEENMTLTFGLSNLREKALSEAKQNANLSNGKKKN